MEANHIFLYPLFYHFCLHMLSNLGNNILELSQHGLIPYTELTAKLFLICL